MAGRWSNQVTHGGRRLVVEDGRLLVVSLGTGWVSFVGIPLSFALTLASILMLVWVTLAAVGEAPWQLAVGVTIAVVTLGSAMWTLVRYTKKRQALPPDQHVLVAIFDLKARQLLSGHGHVVAHLDEVVRHTTQIPTVAPPGHVRTRHPALRTPHGVPGLLERFEKVRAELE